MNEQSAITSQNAMPCPSMNPDFPGLTCNLADKHTGSHYALGYRWPNLRSQSAVPHIPSIFDGLTMDEALALRAMLHGSRDTLRRSRNGAAELMKELAYGPVRDCVKRNHHSYCDLMSEVSDLACNLFMANLA
jgi:hypothetical protein